MITCDYVIVQESVQFRAMADQQIIAFDRNFSLLSFGEEAEEDESTVASVSKVGYLLNTVLCSFFPP